MKILLRVCSMNRSISHLEQYLDDRSFNQKLIDELVDKIYVSSKGMIEVRMKCSDVFQKVMEIME